MPYMRPSDWFATEIFVQVKTHLGLVDVYQAHIGPDPDRPPREYIFSMSPTNLTAENCFDVRHLVWDGMPVEPPAPSMTFDDKSLPRIDIPFGGQNQNVLDHTSKPYLKLRDQWSEYFMVRERWAKNVIIGAIKLGMLKKYCRF